MQEYVDIAEWATLLLWYTGAMYPVIRGERATAALICLLLAVVSIVAFLHFKHTNITVIRTESGFVPSRVVIEVGDSITFKTAIGKDFWPASNSHPTHDLYPAFDPKRALKSVESWTFIFDRAGVWGFHDHLHSDVHGTVIVRGSDGGSISACTRQKNAATLKPECWAAEIAGLLAIKSLTAAFDTIRGWYEKDPEFRKNCHDVMHIVGSQAYKEFSNSQTTIDRPETSYCGYGFYHGFMEEMLFEKGLGEYGDARTYCEKVSATTLAASGPCYHGIGHAVFDSLDSSLWGNDAAMVGSAVKTCEAVLPSEYARARCLSGVFNALANAYSARTYRLTFRDSEPIPICRTMKALYQPFCYMELGNGYIRDKNWDTQQSFRFIKSLPNPSARLAVITGYMDTEVRRTIDTAPLADLRSTCLMFSGVAEQTACMEGSVIGLCGIGESGKEQGLVRSYCGGYGPQVQASCLASAACLSGQNR